MVKTYFFPQFIYFFWIFYRPNEIYKFPIVSNESILKELNILQENSVYKNLNPSIEANILRAIYLSKIHNLKYSLNTIDYLYSKIGFLNDKFNNPLERIITVREQYPKYSIIKENDILNLFFNNSCCVWQHNNFPGLIMGQNNTIYNNMGFFL